jgi:hypothetical protein
MHGFTEPPNPSPGKFCQQYEPQKIIALSDACRAPDGPHIPDGCSVS